MKRHLFLITDVMYSLVFTCLSAMSFRLCVTNIFLRRACVYYHISLHYDERVCVCAYGKMCESSLLQTACCNLIVIQEMHAASHT